MLNIIQIILSVILLTSIVLQAKAGGLGGAFGGVAYHTRRGAERTLFVVTIVTACLFVIIAAVNALGK